VSADLVLRADAALVGGEFRPAAIVVHNGRIREVLNVSAEVAAAEEHRLAPDEVLLPGLVDTHVHVNEPGRTEWEGFATATRAAAAGGVTTLVDMPLNSIPPTVDTAALATKRAAATGKCHIDVGFWGGAVPGNLGELAGLHAAGVFGFKAFLCDSGVPEFPPLSWPELADVLAEVARLDALLVVHAEDGVPEDGGVDAGPRYAEFLATRPNRVEDRAISRLADLAGAARARVHVLHLSSAGAVPIIAEARAAGVRITAETCPHYLTLAAEDVPDGATEFKCCPPIRDRANADGLWRGLLDGTIDCVVSDHSPCPADLKRRGGDAFGPAWGGISSVQLGLPVVWTEARRRGVPLATVVRWMAAAPADVVGMAAGRIEVGGPASLVAFAPEASFEVEPGLLLHRHPLTPYRGRRLTGTVRSTWLRGRRENDVPSGRFVNGR